PLRASRRTGSTNSLPATTFSNPPIAARPAGEPAASRRGRSNAMNMGGVATATASGSRSQSKREGSCWSQPSSSSTKERADSHDRYDWLRAREALRHSIVVPLHHRHREGERRPAVLVVLRPELAAVGLD